MNIPPSSNERLATPVYALALTAFLLIWLPSWLSAYGYFIDELYYLACAARPDFGYVDHPPFSILVLAASRAVFGDSLPALRLLPALAFAATLFLTAALARRFGAGTSGQVLAVLAVIFAPVLMIMCGFFSMNGFGILLWTACFYVLAVLFEKDEPRLWLLFGLLAGIGLINKHTFVTLGFGLAVGVLLTPARRHLAGRWLWLGAAVAGAILLPNIVWQILNDWPSLEFYRNAAQNKNLAIPPHVALLHQILYYNPLSFPITLAGFAFFLRSQKGAPYRAIGWTCATLFVMMILSQQSRPDRIAGIYPVLFAAGTAWIESFARRRGRTWIPVAYGVLVAVIGLAFLPLSVPLLPPPQMAAYAAATGIVPQTERGAGKVAALPQWFADRIGWEAFVEDVEKAAARLSPEERAQAVIVAPSYGHAGALELFGSESLPTVLSTQNTYFLWAFDVLAERQVEAGIAIGSNPDNLRQLYEEVELAAVHRCTYCMPWRSELPIYLVRGPKVPLAEVWGRFKHYE